MGTDSVGEQTSERQFLENLLNTRVNFLVAVFALASAAAATFDDHKAQFAILGASSLVCVMLAVAASRAQFKLDIMFRLLPRDHPARTTDRAAKLAARRLGQFARFGWGGSRRRLVGYWIPWTTVLFLLVGTGAAGAAWARQSLTTAPGLDERLSKSEAAVRTLSEAIARRDLEMGQALKDVQASIDGIREAAARERAANSPLTLPKPKK